MDLIDRLKVIGERFARTKDQVETEEATKNAFIMPFIAALGFDVFNPTEVIPEFVADIGIKKGEKVDYCIFKDGKSIIIMECKHWKQKLDRQKNSQLHRYFHATNSRFAILTNGAKYQFFTDLEEKNKMDSKPFFEFNIEKITEQIAAELKKFHKENFDIDEILSTANELKYSKQIKEILSADFRTPSEEFTKYLAQKTYTGRVTAKVIEQFKNLIQKSVKALLNELINERIQSALENQDQNAEDKDTPGKVFETVDIETTEEELEAFRIVQAILRREFDVTRIVYRDVKHYFGILLDDNNRKPICRLWLNRNQKYISLFDEEKNEEKVQIEKLEDIYLHEQRLLETAKNYDNPTIKEQHQITQEPS